MATSTPFTLQELKAFHNIDRQAYAWLMFNLGLAPEKCSEIVAFWNWLERIGCVNFVYKTVGLPIPLFLELAHETKRCLDGLTGVSFPVADNNLLPVMRDVGRKPISIGFVYANKEKALKYMKKFDESVCLKALTDIIPTSLANGHDGAQSSGEFVRHEAIQVQDNGPSLSSQTVFDQLWQDNGTHSHKTVDQKSQGHGNETQNLDKAPDNQTLFVTFSKGHPITQQELHEFFSRRYGRYCVQSIYVSTLFARVIVTSPLYIVKILGETELVQFNIHGKDVRIRRYVQRRAPSSSWPTNQW